MRIFTFIVLLISFSLTAKVTKKVPSVTNAKYVYSELYPSENLNFSFKWIAGCKEDKLNIEKFESFKSYPSVEGESTEKVRILNIYVDDYSPCSQTPKLTKIQILKILGDPKLMTHIRLVFKEDISLKH